MATQGGKRPGAGRPTFYDGDAMRKVTMFLPESLIEAFREYGKGNLAGGVRSLGEKHLLKRKK